MRHPVVTCPVRKLSHKFMLAEAIWILEGRNDISIGKYSQRIMEFSDDRYHFQGAYGPKVTEQLRYVVDTLLKDKHSRQAVIGIWREQPRESRDVPCTLTLQFMIRDAQIHCIANMRSSDLWLGWVYDVFNFTMITTWVGSRIREIANCDLELGNLYLNAGSQHIYVENFIKCELCLQADNTGSIYPISLMSFRTPIDLMTRLIASRDTLGLVNMVTPQYA